MRDPALFSSLLSPAAAPAPQAPARNNTPPPPSAPTFHPPSTLDTYNSHRKIKRPKLACRHIYRPARRHTLSRIDESSPRMRPRSKSLQHSTDFSSTAPFLRSRSNISADTSRSVPVCNQSHELSARRDSSASPQYAEPRDSDSSSGRSRRSDQRASMSDEPVALSLALPHYPNYYYRDGCVLQGNYKVKKSKHSNLYLAFMY